MVKTGCVAKDCLDKIPFQTGSHLERTKSVLTITNPLTGGTSPTSSIKQTFQYHDLSQIQCYNCNKTGHTAKNCRNKKKSKFTTSKFGYKPYRHAKATLK